MRYGLARGGGAFHICIMRTLVVLCFGALLGIVGLPYLLIRQPGLPAGTNVRSAEMPYSEAELLVDRTRWDAGRERAEIDQRIFDAMLREIDAAETFLVADFFLWNPWMGAIESGSGLRPLSEQLADALIAKRIRNPDMPMLVITDPINRLYGESEPAFFRRMAEAGIPVVFTDLDRLPDSNRLYAPQARFWKRFFQPDASARAKGRFPNPFDPEGEKLGLDQMLRLLYFKANHRKVLVAGREEAPPRLIIGSLNPADGSARHGNLAALVTGPVAFHAAESELEVARWSAENSGQVLGDRAVLERDLAGLRARLDRAGGVGEVGPGEPSVTYLSEGAIREALIEELNAAVRGTRIDAGIFYFSDRKVVGAMKSAVRRGAELRLLLDANRDAFGREKNGVPNRPLAAEFMELAAGHTVEVRWAATRGEQYHAKALRIVGPRQDLLLLGSANWTRRNLAGLNLEANLLFRHPPEIGPDFDRYFERLWSNADGITETLPYGDLAESGWSLRWKTWLYRFQEWSGASTF